ncbi:MAG TPA: hypothetical protein VIX14_00960 [Terriglobales bacterium]
MEAGSGAGGKDSRALNDWIKDYAAKQGLVFLDYYAPMANSKRGLKAELSQTDSTRTRLATP